jgi:hypothetical protein
MRVDYRGVDLEQTPALKPFAARNSHRRLGQGNRTGSVCGALARIDPVDCPRGTNNVSEGTSNEPAIIVRTEWGPESILYVVH